jgi:hypothetical protein
MGAMMSTSLTWMHLGSVAIICFGCALTQRRGSWAATAVFVLVVAVLVVVGGFMGWSGHTWSVQSWMGKAVALLVGMALPACASYITIVALRSRSVSTRIACGLVLGMAATLIAPTAWLAVACGMTGDCL